MTTVMLLIGSLAMIAVTQEPYRYQRAGRRDPFVRLSLRGERQTPSQPKVFLPTYGLAALRVHEVQLTGILRSSRGAWATVAGPDGRTHIVRPGDRLADGHIRSIAVSSTGSWIVVEQVGGKFFRIYMRPGGGL